MIKRSTKRVSNTRVCVCASAREYEKTRRPSQEDAFQSDFIPGYAPHTYIKYTWPFLLRAVRTHDLTHADTACAR